MRAQRAPSYTTTTIVRTNPIQTRNVEDVLSRVGARLEAWQLRALFLGAQASTNVRLGPQNLFPHIFGDEPVLGDNLQDANANLQSLMNFWNQLVAQHEAGTVELSRMALSHPPTREQLQAAAKRRIDEITWFTRGIDAGGDDPMEFGTEGGHLLQNLAEASAYLDSYLDLLGRMPEQDILEARQPIDRLTSAIEMIIANLMTVSADVRRRAIEDYRRVAGHRTDDGIHIERPIKIGRNEPCPCGSGRKWKRCCGAPTLAH